VQAYTSPHLARFHERIRLSDGLISEAALQAVLEECEAANGGVPITYFEITTVAGLLAFSRDPADYCLLEVGLGGRLDATNVLDRPKLCAITPVSIDHQQFLGDTLAEIAGEKAGILKAGVPCVVGRQEPDALDVIEAQALKTGAPLIIEGQDFQVYEEHGRLVFQDNEGLLDLPLPSLIGAHQVGNAGIAIAGLRALGLGEAACEAAVKQADWAARLQHLKSGALVELAGDAELWLDGGHNAAAGAALAEALGRLDKRPLHLICGMLNSKDVRSYLRPLAVMSDLRRVRRIVFRRRLRRLPRLIQMHGSSSAARFIWRDMCCARTFEGCEIIFSLGLRFDVGLLWGRLVFDEYNWRSGCNGANCV